MNDLINELSQNFINYAMAVNTDRSIPDAKSGLKPVAKRILYATYAGGYTSNKQYVKNAKIVGDVIGKYHPHGDSSVYSALVRLSQDWVMRYPLMDFHGNNGNIAGDGAAAYRYTEGRLSKLVEDGMLFGIKKDNVDFIPTFDDSSIEPITLPTIFPNLLCNPNMGIGVAMASSWGCHNLKEVANAIYNYIDGKEPMIPGPDFPTGGEIINSKDIPNIMKTGRGTVKIRGRYKVDKNDIIFYELPYGVNTETLLNEISELTEHEELKEIEDIQDQSNKQGLKIVIKCYKNTNINLILQKLFKRTSLQSSFSYNQVALVDGEPKELNLRDCCEIYLKHNIECLLKETNFDLLAAEKRNHIIKGLLIALEDIDNVINLIKKSNNTQDAKNELIKKYKLDETQAKSILAMRLSSLAHIEKIELENEQKELIKKINELNNIISSYEVQKNKIKERLSNIVNKYGDERRTLLSNIEIPKEDKEIQYVEPEKCVVVLTENGNIKRIPTASYRVQKRNGKGIKSQSNITSMVLRTNTIDSLMVFTNKGRMYRLLVDNIPIGTNVSAGVAVRALVQMEPGEKTNVIYSIYRDTTAEYVLFVTKNGLVKKTKLDEYTKIRKKSGTAAIKLKENDDLASVLLVKDEPLLLLTKQGMAIHFNTTDIGESGRVSMGIKGMGLKEGDEVAVAIPVRDSNDDLAIFSRSGNGKRVKLKDFPKQNRGGKGVICLKGDEVAAAAMVADDDQLLICGNHNSICIGANDISELGRTAVGVSVLKDDTVVSVSKI